MPPPPRSCVACKLSKTKCTNFAPGHRCDRCERVGLRCVAAQSRSREASRAALGPAVRQYLLNEEGPAPSDSNSAGSSGSAPPDELSDGLIKVSDGRVAKVAWMPSESCGSRIIFDTVRESLLKNPPTGGFNVGVAILREWMAIARKRDAYSLMQTSIGVSQLLGISLDAIVVADDMPPIFDQQGRIVTPAPIAAIANASMRYTVTRTCHNGHMGFSCSDAFEQEICHVEELYQAWRENKVQTFSIFTHPDDFPAIPALVGKLWQGVSGNQVPYLEASNKTVRIRRRIQQLANQPKHSLEYEFVPCSLKGVIYVEGEGRRVSFAFTFEPKDAGQRPLEHKVAVRIPKQEVRDDCEQPGGDITYGVSQSALGKRPLLGHWTFNPSDETMMRMDGIGGSYSSPPAAGKVMNAMAGQASLFNPSLVEQMSFEQFGSAPVSASNMHMLSGMYDASHGGMGPSCAGSMQGRVVPHFWDMRMSQHPNQMSGLPTGQTPRHSQYSAAMLNELGSFLGVGVEDGFDDTLVDGLEGMLEDSMVGNTTMPTV